MRLVLLLLATLIVIGCASNRTASPEEYAGARPSKGEIEELLNAYLRKSLKDP